MKDDSLVYACQKNCMLCDENKKICEYRKARGRIINRMIYAAKMKKLKERASKL